MGYNEEFNKLFQEKIDKSNCSLCAFCDDKGSLRFDNEHYICNHTGNEIKTLYQKACDNFTPIGTTMQRWQEDIDRKLFIKLCDIIFK